MIRGVIFDMDGTLFEADYDWPAIRRQIGVPASASTILDHLASLPPGEREEGERLLRSIESKATRGGRLKPGARRLLDFLRGKALRLALVTNNHRASVDWVLSTFGLGFDLVLSRETGLYKPSPAPLLKAARGLEIEPGELAAVGDNEYDNRAAHDAGMALVIIVSPEEKRFEGSCDHSVRDLDQVRAIFEALFDEGGFDPAARG